MSAERQPQRREEPQRPSPPQSGFAEALLEESRAQAEASRRHEHLRKLIEPISLQLSYWWQTPDERDARMTVYYDISQEEVEFRGAWLQEIDHRPPTAQETVRFERQFEEELSQENELWRSLNSEVWQKHLAP